MTKGSFPNYTHKQKKGYMIDINKLPKKRKKGNRPNLVCVYLNEDICQDFKDWCIKYNVTHTGVINALIREHLEKYINRKNK